MDQLIANFPQHLQEALTIARAIDWPEHKGELRSVMITGLGGSGIGGAIVSRLVEGEAGIPIAVNNHYELPSWVNEHTLVIACSYSGNTEETLSAFEIARSRGATIACICSGGSLLASAQEHALNHVVIPGGNPPRSMLGYSLVQLFFVLAHYGIISRDFESQLEAAAKLISDKQDAIKETAEGLASFLHGRIPVIYSDRAYEPIAVRFRQQLNENSKVLGWQHALPEMNHNELVGWAGGNDQLAVVFLRNSDDFDRNVVRMGISSEIMSARTPHVCEITSQGESPLERSIYHIHLGDWATWYLAQLRGVDAVEVDVITHLKSELAKL